MADLIGAMDSLWFHKIVLFSEPTSLPHVPKHYIEQPHLNSTDSLKYPSSSLTSSIQSSSSFSLATLPDEELSFNVLSPPPEEEISPELTPFSTPSGDKDYLSFEKREENNNLIGKERPRSTNLARSITRSHSSASSTEKRPKRRVNGHPGSVTRLEKSSSCRSFEELELEEVKGFMDLGFKFNKEHLSPRLLRVVPGLQRLGHLNHNIKSNDKEEDEEVEKGIEEEGIVRPYLSEAWLIKRPDSPLLSFRVPRVYAASDMKKHLRFWARTVASAIQQESWDWF